MKQRKAIKIDSENKTVVEVSVSRLEDLQEAVGGYIQAGVYLPKHHLVYVNEEGLMNDSLASCFVWHGAHQPFIGNGLVVGSDEDGNDQDCEMSVEEVKSRVRFLDRAEIALMAQLGKLDSAVESLYQEMKPLGEWRTDGA